MNDIKTAAISPPEDPTTVSASAIPSSWSIPLPSDDEIWNAMTREGQLSALQDHFASDDCTTPSDVTVAEILARARAGDKRV